MSFLSIIKTIGKDLLLAEPVIAKIGEITLPAFSPAIAAVDTMFQQVQGSIIKHELTNPVDGQGQLKAAAVQSDLAVSLQVAQEALAIGGKTLTYDTAALQAAIDAQVAAYNNFANLKATFKIVDLPKT